MPKWFRRIIRWVMPVNMSNTAERVVQIGVVLGKVTVVNVTLLNGIRQHCCRSCPAYACCGSGPDGRDGPA